ncbi:MAG: hypothetical protein QNL62_06060 [Gammaproteobacteria bacterium]|nr:hypothetical protein [Gammaproteobacteria bacterium]
MTDIRIQPEEVGAEIRFRIIDFLNNVNTAQEILIATEIPDEVDIGIKLSQRILDEREALGGSFTSLNQIAGVRLIGPERFTEIILGLTNYFNNFSNTLSINIQPMLEEVLRLKKELENMGGIDGGPQYVISLEPIIQNPFEGQTIQISARVTDRLTNTPAVNKSLTLSTSWGELEHSVGFSINKGNVIRVRTDTDGFARFKLLPKLNDQLKGRQQDVLESALSFLTPDAPNPKSTSGGFLKIVSHYQMERNTNLRIAVDRYYLDKEHQISPDNDYLSAWGYSNALIVAYLTDMPGQENTGVPVKTIGILMLKMKDWVGAWFQIYMNKLANENPVDDIIVSMKALGGNGSQLSGRILAYAENYMAGQRGVVGTMLGKKNVNDAITGFLGTGMDDLDLEIKLDLFPALTTATRVIRDSSVGLKSIKMTQTVSVAQPVKLYRTNDKLITSVE